MEHRQTLEGMEGIKGVVEALFVGSVDEAVAALGDGEIMVTSSGHLGAINVWLTKKGFHCQRCAWQVTEASAIVPSLTAVNEWLKHEWPLIGDRDRTAW